MKRPLSGMHAELKKKIALVANACLYLRTHFALQQGNFKLPSTVGYTDALLTTVHHIHLDYSLQDYMKTIGFHCYQKATVQTRVNYTEIRQQVLFQQGYFMK